MGVGQSVIGQEVCPPRHRQVDHPDAAVSGSQAFGVPRHQEHRMPLELQSPYGRGDPPAARQGAPTAQLFGQPISAAGNGNVKATAPGRADERLGQRVELHVDRGQTDNDAFVREAQHHDATPAEETSPCNSAPG
jgi:hypothetical protein